MLSPFKALSLLSNPWVLLAIAALVLALFGGGYMKGREDEEAKANQERIANLTQFLETINDADNAESALEQCLDAQLIDGLPVRWDFGSPGRCIER
jgi:hypothetical protein